ncbi:hypothetical protein HO133_006917 [Letharia lupina]|uniref:Uncharacterized protein n=1 Tax=Letharia lupina TaxID=560253 RepID=A0A8H6F6D0_9LECA|nr:uncharacterized protein HO133_006917 [Letharia lupina]KAF6217447.1 hypothetical protein HO133_006917 [Letharia lupina]
MMLYAPDGLLMVLLEYFDHLTSAIDCWGDDGTMSLTFNSTQAYEYALQAWGFVNANANGKFLLIANHAGCGPDEERQAYIITSIREDAASLTTYLAANVAPWSDIGGSYDLHFGHIVTSRHTPERRGLIEKLKGNFDETKTADFDPELGHPGEVRNIWHDDNRLMLDCIDCFVAGSFHLIGAFETHHWDVEEATLSASPKAFNATVELQAKITRTDKLDKLSDKIEEKADLFSMPVPDLGIEIPKVLKLGLTLSYQIGFSTKVAGSATFVLGATTSLPDDAIITVDLKDLQKSSWTGFEGAALVPIFDVTELSASVKFAVFTQVDLAFGIDIIGHDSLDVELNLKIPQLSTNFAAGYKEKGFCNQDDGALMTGVIATTALAIELWLEVKSIIEKKKNDLYSYKFFNLTKTLDEHCAPLSIPGLTIETIPSVSELLPIPTQLITPPVDR